MNTPEIIIKNWGDMSWADIQKSKGVQLVIQNMYEEHRLQVPEHLADTPGITLDVDLHPKYAGTIGSVIIDESIEIL